MTEWPVGRGRRRVVGHTVREDVEREIAYHLEMRARELEGEGYRASEARAEAERRFGDVAEIARRSRRMARRKERTMRRGEMMQALWQDVKYAVRTLRGSPGYTVVALITLSLGIGANSAIFSVVNGVLLRPLPFPDSGELVRAYEVSGRGRLMNGAWRNFLDWREAGGFEALVTHTAGGTQTVLTGEAPLRVGAAGVSDGFFRMLGVEPARGRVFLAEEKEFGADAAAIVSHGFWRLHLGSAPNLEEVRLTVAGMNARVVGVMPAGFDYPGDVDIWYPLELFEHGESRTAHNYRIVGRLAEGVSLAQADAELDAITRGIIEADPGVREEEGFEEYFPHEARLVTLHESLVGDTRRPLWILLGAAGMVLLVACTNLASTTLARGMSREREIAVRRSLGAGRGRVVRLLFTEGLLLAVGGGALGLVVAALVVGLLPSLAPDGVPRIEQIRLDGAVVGFTFAAAVVTAILFGLVPAVRVADADAAGALRSGTRGGADRGRQRLWSGLVAAEVALALVLLIGSGLLIRSFRTVIEQDPGFRTEDVLLVTVNPPSARYGDNESKRAYYDELLASLRVVPGVAEVGLANVPPLGWVANGLVDVRGGPEPNLSARYHLVSPGYFRALGIPLLQGRLFDERDVEDGEHVVVVNEALAELAWPGEDPIGKQMTAGGMDDYWEKEKWATVVGVVPTVRQAELTRAGDATYYFHYRQRPFRAFSMVATIRPESGPATALVSAARNAIRRIDPDVPAEFSTIEQRLSGSLAGRRFTMLVLGVFAAVALLLAGVGIYGVVSYTVARRTREIGIRIALGARPVAVRRLVQKRTLALAAVGGLAGIGGALALTRVMQSLLYEVSPTDPVTFIAVVVVLAGVTWVASLVPALRTTRIDPMVTMRSE